MFHFALLLLVLLNLARNPAALREVERRVLSRAFERLAGLLIIGRELERAGDLVDEPRELLGRLPRDGLDVALEDEEVLGLHEDVVLDECGVVRGIRDDVVVQFVFGRSGRGNTGEGSASAQAREHTRSADAKTNVCARLSASWNSRSLETPFLLVRVLVDSENPRPGCRTLAFPLALLFVVLLRLRRTSALPIRVSGESTATVDEVLELAGAELGRLDSDNERDGIHEVGLARAVRANGGGEVAEGVDDDLVGRSMI